MRSLYVHDSRVRSTTYCIGFNRHRGALNNFSTRSQPRGNVALQHQQPPRYLFRAPHAIAFALSFTLFVPFSFLLP